MSGELGRPKDALHQQAQAGRDTYAAGRDITIYQSPQAPLAPRVHPEAETWVASIHATADDYDPLGSGIVLDERRILTCAHVLTGTAGPWVAFPKAEDSAAAERRQVARVVLPGTSAPVKDLAILVLAEPVPAGVTPATLRCPRPTDLVTKRWWAFGFPQGDPVGSSADGQVGSALAYGWVRLDTASRYPVERGFSGGGLWSPDYQAVVAIVSHASPARDDGRAITLHQADLCFPDQALRHLAERYRPLEAGPLALAAWGWSLQGDSEATRHWRPRARGVSIDSERGYRFRGRTAALRAITTWLDRERIDRRALVVTGVPGAGKSAVLGRIVTTADHDAVRELPASDTAVKATIGSVACAVHAKGATALEIATKIAQAASAALPERIEDFAPAIRDALTQRAGSRFNVIIDALDESTEARTVISKVIRPLTETCADVGAQVIVGSRHKDADGDLPAAFGNSARLVDLDEPEFSAEEDLAAYALATLQLAGDERNGNPYASDEIAAPVAERIAALSEGNFLVAGLTARTHGLWDEAPVDPAQLRFTSDVGDAMREYLKRIPDVAGASAESLLLALAYAESPGLPVSLWHVALKTLGLDDIPEPTLKRFARSSAASFLVESTGGDGASAEFRLFHQALNDALLRARVRFVARREDEQALTRAFMAAGQEQGWDQAPAYLLRSLPAHAARAGLMDDLLADDDYLLYADLLRLLPLVAQAKSAAGRQRGRLLRLASRATITADAANRIALFSVAKALEGLPGAYTKSGIQSPYRALWASAQISAEHSILQGHIDAVNDVAAITINGQPRLASASSDRTIRIWDPATATQTKLLEGEANGDNALCAVTMNGRPHLATSGRDHTVPIWDPITGMQTTVLEGHTSWVRAICPITINDQPHLATGSSDNTIRIWDPTTAIETTLLEGHTDWIRAICPITINDQPYLASSSRDNTVRIWDPTTGMQTTVLEDHTDAVHAICPITVDGHPHLATASRDNTVRIWNPTTGIQTAVLEGHTDAVNALCAVIINGRPHLATASSDHTIRIWDPVTATQTTLLEGHTNGINAVCAFIIDGRPYLATGSRDNTVRIWDPITTQTTKHNRHTNRVNAVCPITINDHPHLATGSRDNTVRIWDPVTGMQTAVLEGHTDWIRAICPITINGQAHLATGGRDNAVRIWNPATATQTKLLEGHTNAVNALCTLTIDSHPYLATASSDRTIRIWDPTTGMQATLLDRHTNAVNALCTLTIDSHPYLATASSDHTIRIWNPTTATQTKLLEGHTDAVHALCTLTINGHPHLASASSDHTIRIWNPVTATQTTLLEGHTDWIRAVCPISINGRPLLATASDDRTVRIWDPAAGIQVLVVPTRDWSLSVCYSGGLLAIGTEKGLLVIRLDPEYLSRSLQ